MEYQNVGYNLHIPWGAIDWVELSSCQHATAMGDANVINGHGDHRLFVAPPPEAQHRTLNISPSHNLVVRNASDLVRGWVLNC